MQKVILTAIIMPFLFLCLSASRNTSGFKTPSGNIACEVYEGILRCDLRTNSATVPKAPADCELDWGNMFILNAKDKGKRLCAGDTVFGEQGILAYGEIWRHSGFICQSASTGLTCTHRKKHGWMLNRVTQRLF